MRTAKVLTSAGLASALLLGSATMAFAQSYTPSTGSSYTSSTGTTGTTGTSGTTGTTATSGTTGTSGTTTGTGTTGTTPGAPNTGAGGNAATNIALLVASALAVLAGGTYLARKTALQ